MAKKETAVGFAAALKAIQKGEIATTYFFYGEESFLSNQLSEAIVLKIFGQPKDDFNLHIFYGKESPATDIVNTAMSFPILAERKVVILRDAELVDKAGKDTLEKYFKNPLESTCFVAITRKPDFRQKFFSTLREKALAVELKKLDERDLPLWIESMLGRLKKTIEPKAAMLLASRVELSLQELSMELEKLSTYAGSRNEITDEDVEAVVGVSRQFNVFEFCAAIGNRDFSRASQIMSNMLRQGEQPVGMIAMLYRHLSILWTICDYRDLRKPGFEMEKVLMEKFRVYPNYLKGYLPQADNFSAEEFRSLLPLLMETDARIKSSSVRDETILQNLIYRLTQKPTVAYGR